MQCTILYPGHTFILFHVSDLLILETVCWILVWEIGAVQWCLIENVKEMWGTSVVGLTSNINFRSNYSHICRFWNKIRVPQCIIKNVCLIFVLCHDGRRGSPSARCYPKIVASKITWFIIHEFYYHNLLCITLLEERYFVVCVLNWTVRCLNTSRRRRGKITKFIYWFITDVSGHCIGPTLKGGIGRLHPWRWDPKAVPNLRQQANTHSATSLKTELSGSILEGSLQ
jgi:hypothetical protein